MNSRSIRDRKHSLRSWLQRNLATVQSLRQAFPIASPLRTTTSTLRQSERDCSLSHLPRPVQRDPAHRVNEAIVFMSLRRDARNRCRPVQNLGLPCVAAYQPSHNVSRPISTQMVTRCQLLASHSRRQYLIEFIEQLRKLIDQRVDGLCPTRRAG